MTEFKNAKKFGGIGSILMLMGGICSAFFSPAGVISIIGLVMVMLALKQISVEVKDESIFKNYLMYFIVSIIAVFAFIIILAGGVGANLQMYNELISKYQSGNFTNPQQLFEDFLPFITVCLVAFVIFGYC